MQDTFSTRSTLSVGDQTYALAKLPVLEDQGFAISRLPYSTRILLENLLRREDGSAVTASDIEAVASWDPQATPSVEIAFMPARVLLQDFTGVPAVVDLAAMRDAMVEMGGDAEKINPLQPVELVIDHSVQVDEYGSDAAFLLNVEREFERNRERYAFLKWGQRAFDNFKAVPPGTGICHQVNLEYLGRVVMETRGGGEPFPLAYPDTLVGTDSHTTMINGLGILGWGVGGIEAEAAMLGQAISMLVPQVVGFRLDRRARRAGATATDLVLTVTQKLREEVAWWASSSSSTGPGLPNGYGWPTGRRSPTCRPSTAPPAASSPSTDMALDYLQLHRPAGGIADRPGRGVHGGAGPVPHGGDAPKRSTRDTLELDLGTVEPSLAGPKRPQDPDRTLGDVQEDSFLEPAFRRAQVAPEAERRSRHCREDRQVRESEGGQAVDEEEIADCEPRPGSRQGGVARRGRARSRSRTARS